jgi:hypothetical protein
MIRRGFFMKSILKVLIPALIFPVLFISCDFIKLTVYVKFDQETFNEQRQLWQTSNVKNYQYDFSAYGYSGYRGTIFVENGNFKNAVPSEEDSGFFYFMDYSTVDEIYKTIEERFSYYNDTKQSLNDFYYTEILIEYDKTNHIPVKVNYIYNERPFVIVDGTFYFYIDNFSKTE